jgi:hypothetical protein
VPVVTRQEFLSRWRAECERLQRLGALVDPAKLLDEVLADAEALFGSEEHDALTLTEAALESGYSAGHLGRLVGSGTIPNAGRPNAPKIRRADLPRKASRLRRAGAPAKLVGATPGQIAQAVVTSKPGDPR